MMGWKRKVCLAWPVAMLLALGLFAAAVPQARGARGAGDGDDFPLACVDFGGEWRSDKGTVYDIQQRGCEWLQLDAAVGSEQSTTTIVPDNKARSIPGSTDCGVVRYRWNSMDNGTAIETHRKIYQSDRTITELVTLEQVNDDLMLESTYRTIELTASDRGPPQHEYKQEVFRRVSSDSQKLVLPKIRAKVLQK